MEKEEQLWISSEHYVNNVDTFHQYRYIDMRNYINLSLADDRDISDEAIRKLNCLHFTMQHLISGALQLYGNDEFAYMMQHEDYEEAVQELEYKMQALWGFSQRADKHTHKWLLPHLEVGARATRATR